MLKFELGFNAMLDKKIQANMKFRLLIERSRRQNSEVLDYFKLVYQSCFGLAHIIENKNKFDHHLNEEIRSVPASRNIMLIEPITIYEPIARVNLSRFKLEGLNVKKLTDVCLKTATDFKKASKNDFLNCIDHLAIILVKPPFNFEDKAVLALIDSYNLDLLPSFRHSPAYREHYNPHYRLVIPELFTEIFEKIEAIE